MSRTRPRLLLAAAIGILAACPPPASAHASHALCNGSSGVSALNQYCEDIPGARGGSTPAPGQPSVATSLPPRAVAQLTKSPARSKRAELLGLPAAADRVAIRTDLPAPSVAASAPWLFIAILGAILVLAIGLLAARRRRPAAP
jgi:hypothetical protein